MNNDDIFDWSLLITAPLETALWINALADRTPAGALLRPGLSDLAVRLLHSARPRAKA
jgi:hypothetical protein